ncbi:hypothetical protein BJY04DRAFT_179305 [Aspergillus karnatakaensis]|uniref:ssDNA endodeoxyribonuclease RAD2 n=1 Tax=Aspergillus karnatakaensis TaxID=1810916 RepID=UPI003CCD5E6B
MQGTREVEDEEADSLFVQDYNGVQHSSMDDVFENAAASDDEDLQRAIEMSLQAAGGPEHHDKDIPDISINRASPSAQPVIPEPAIPVVEPRDESDDDELDFAAALAQSKRAKKEPTKAASHSFDGPLPFETLKLSKPFNVKKAPQKEAQDSAGGFEKESSKKDKETVPLPPWFSGQQQNPEFIADQTDNDALENYRDHVMTPDHFFLKNHRSPEVIDVDQFPEDKVIDLDPASPIKIDSKSTPPRVANTTTEEDQAQTQLVDLPSRENRTSELPNQDAESEKDAYKWEATDDEKAEHSPSPPFEDVAIQREEPKDEKDERSPSPEFEDVTIQAEEIDYDPLLQEHIEPHQPVDIADDEVYSDPEDEELMRQLAAEGEEHVRFTATLNSTAHTEGTFDYEQELKQLRSQQAKDRRDADEVTQIMITECQQLLKLFGLPYVTAPMEAEAQCAELVSLGLVDGIITDDSDIFLFGGTRVYKNMFNQSKYVECYLTTDLEKEYALHRRKLISFAHLLGSDYTEGISGIGPVTALEILTEFSTLEEFRDWWTRVQTGADMSNSEHAAFYKKFRKQATKIFLPPTFPNTQVDTAYLQPEADRDPSPFSWGVPDLHGLRNFLMATIGWSQERTDEVLVPVIRDINQREQEGTQSNITNFFSGPQGAGAFAPRVRSGGQSRMEKAFSRLRREAGAEPTEHDDADASPNDSPKAQASARRQKGKGKKRGAPEPGSATENGDGSKSGDETTTRKRRGRKAAKT